MTPDAELTGRRIVVTGASRGIGLVVATELARRGASLALIARDRDGLESARDSLIGTSHVAVAIDVSDANAWAHATSALCEGGAIDGLVTAAGVIGPIGPIGTWDVAEFRTTIEINLIGTLLALVNCLPALKRSCGTVVTFSGGGATAPLPRFDAYAASKAAVVRLTENLARDLEEFDVRLNSVAPGFVVTDMHDTTISAGRETVGPEYFDRTKLAIESRTGDSPQLAADLVAFLMSSESAGISGKLLSARWDPWSDEGFLKRLRTEPDFCTLRRIDGQFFDSSPEP